MFGDSSRSVHIRDVVLIKTVLSGRVISSAQLKLPV